MLSIDRGRCPAIRGLAVCFGQQGARSPFARVLSARWSSVLTAPQSPAQALKLRSYQEDCIRSILKDIDDGWKRLGISIATGGGKTVIVSHLIERLQDPSPDATRTLILAHRRELVTQAANHCRRMYPNKTIEIEMGKDVATGVADITVASVQSLKSPERLGQYDPADFKLVVVDEAHHIVAPSYLDILRHFNLLKPMDKKYGPAVLVGVSATFARPDGLKIGVAIDRIAFKKDFIEGIEENWLASVRFTTVESGANVSRVRTTTPHGDFQTASLSKAVDTPAINDITVGTWLDIAKGRKSTLVFCVDIAHVQNLTNTFRERGIDARFVTSNTPAKLRDERIAAFKDGKYPVLLNCGIFTEGTDIPNIDCIVLARPTKSSTLLQQMVGRGVRMFVGKQNCHIIDMVASLAQGLVTTPTLFGLDPWEILNDADVNQMAEIKEQREREALEQREKEALEQRGKEALEQQNEARRERETVNDDETDVSYTHYDNIHDLLGDTSGERYIRTLSSFSWVQVDSNKWILAGSNNSYLTITRNGPHALEVSATIKNPEHPARSKTPYLRPYSIAQALSLRDAVNAGDSFAKAKWVVPLMLARAKWRLRPASTQQIDFLNRTRDKDDLLDPSRVTKGQAMDMITKMRFGAKGRISRMKTEKAADERSEQRRIRSDRMAGRHIRVGPLDEG